MAEQQNALDLNEVISNILEAEKKAEDIIDKSVADAKNTVNEAAARAAAIRESAEVKVKEEMSEAYNNAEYVAQSQCLIVEKECEDKKKELTAAAEKNTAKAIEVILEQLKGRYDC